MDSVAGALLKMSGYNKRPGGMIQLAYCVLLARQPNQVARRCPAGTQWQSQGSSSGGAHSYGVCSKLDFIGCL